MMDITEIRISLQNNGKLRAFATMTISDAFVVRGMKVIQGSKRLFVAMPSHTDANGNHRDVCHPIDKKTRDEVESKILEKYDEVTGADRMVGAAADSPSTLPNE